MLRGSSYDKQFTAKYGHTSRSRVVRASYARVSHNTTAAEMLLH
jgi:hypothetical protein